MKERELDEKELIAEKLEIKNTAMLRQMEEGRGRVLELSRQVAYHWISNIIIIYNTFILS